MPNMRRYDFENPPSDPEDDYGFNNQFGDDPYDSYEDYYLDTGYDPYGVFSDDMAGNTIMRLKRRLVAFARAAKHFWKWHTSAKYRKSCDHIPF